MSKLSELCAQNLEIQKQIDREGTIFLEKTLNAFFENAMKLTGTSPCLANSSRAGTSRWNSCGDSEYVRVEICVELSGEIMERLNIDPEKSRYGIVGLSQVADDDYFIGVMFSSEDTYMPDSQWDMTFNIDVTPDKIGQKMADFLVNDPTLKHGQKADNHLQYH